MTSVASGLAADVRIERRSAESAISRGTWKTITSLTTVTLIGGALILAVGTGLTAPAVSPVDPAAAAGGALVFDDLDDGGGGAGGFDADRGGGGRGPGDGGQRARDR